MINAKLYAEENGGGETAGAGGARDASGGAAPGRGVPDGQGVPDCPLAHMAVIMDGNGRWAEKRGLPRAMGHRAGAGALRRVVELSVAYGLRCLTVYAFSTENWKRTETEIRALMTLLDEYIDKELENLRRQGVSLRILGDLRPFAPSLRRKIDAAVAATAGGSKLAFSIALNYGGRQELLRGAKALAARALSGENPEDWREEDLAKELYTWGLPEPDLLVRTGGDLRISNFLLWQIAYAELWYTETYWPDFGEKEFTEALDAFRSRQRRFGGV